MLGAHLGYPSNLKDCSEALSGSTLSNSSLAHVAAERFAAYAAGAAGGHPGAGAALDGSPRPLRAPILHQGRHPVRALRQVGARICHWLRTYLLLDSDRDGGDGLVRLAAAGCSRSLHSVRASVATSFCIFGSLSAFVLLLALNASACTVRTGSIRGAAPEADVDAAAGASGGRAVRGFPGAPAGGEPRAAPVGRGGTAAPMAAARVLMPARPVQDRLMQHRSQPARACQCLQLEQLVTACIVFVTACCSLPECCRVQPRAMHLKAA